ncbi:hypothetical protein [Rugamonas aquatica]|uniref:Uncharacterized protein n=1 Tax=Rugamonas aquatica TaxID=2743357 RepID=A0A6A7N6N8_9BURK|nr:hypothetical protein [Rugamonas aquatica]MQA40649.1 hypothetical protein [Rugamonas aquatica]
MQRKPPTAVMISLLLAIAVLLFDRSTHPTYGMDKFNQLINFGIVPGAVFGLCGLAHLLLGRGRWKARTLILAAAYALALANLVMLGHVTLPAAIDAYYFPCGPWLIPVLAWYWLTRWQVSRERIPHPFDARSVKPPS